MPAVTILNRSSVPLHVRANRRGVMTGSSDVAANGGRGNLSVNYDCTTLSVYQGNTQVLLIGNGDVRKFKEITIVGGSPVEFDYSGTESR